MLNIGKIAYLTSNPHQKLEELAQIVRGEIFQEENYLKLYSPLGKFFIFDINNLSPIFGEEKFTIIRVDDYEHMTKHDERILEALSSNQTLVEINTAKIEKTE